MSSSQNPPLAKDEALSSAWSSTRVDQTSATDERQRASELKLLYPEFDNLLLRFLAKLEAVPVLGTRDSFAIKPGRYAACLESLHQDTEDEDVLGYVDKLRHDIINDSIVAVKVSTIFHEIMLVEIHDSISYQLREIILHSSTEATKKLIRDIKSNLSTSVEIEKGFLCPDDSYKLRPFNTPGVIFEISFSQTYDDMYSKARKYLLESRDFGVQVVVGIKSTYPEADDLSIHVWRHRIRKDGTGYETWTEVDDKIVDKEGMIIDIVSGSPRRYSLRLGDFASADALASHYPDADLDQEVVLKYEDLLAYYQLAKEEHQQLLAVS